MTFRELRHGALAALRVPDPQEKVSAVHALAAAAPLPDPRLAINPRATLRVARPRRASCGPPKSGATRGRDPAGRAALLHSIAHIEFNAINLALDAIWRFPGMPPAFYLDWLRVADEEATHFTLLRGRLLAHACSYGDFTAHNGLWEMARKRPATCSPAWPSFPARWKPAASTPLRPCVRSWPARATTSPRTSSM